MLSDPKRDFNVIYVYGKTNLVMEGCKRIEKYDQSEIRIAGDHALSVKGEGLVFREMGNGTVGVTGEIKQIEFI